MRSAKRQAGPVARSVNGRSGLKTGRGALQSLEWPPVHHRPPFRTTTPAPDPTSRHQHTYTTTTVATDHRTRDFAHTHTHTHTPTQPWPPGRPRGRGAATRSVLPHMRRGIRGGRWGPPVQIPNSPPPPPAQARGLVPTPPPLPQARWQHSAMSIAAYS